MNVICRFIVSFKSGNLVRNNILDVIKDAKNEQQSSVGTAVGSKDEKEKQKEEQKEEDWNRLSCSLARSKRTTVVSAKFNRKYGTRMKQSDAS